MNKQWKKIRDFPDYEGGIDIIVKQSSGLSKKIKFNINQSKGAVE